MSSASSSNGIPTPSPTGFPFQRCAHTCRSDSLLSRRERDTGLGDRMNDMGDGSLTDPLAVLASDGIGTATSDGFGDDILAAFDQIEA